MGRGESAAPQVSRIAPGGRETDMAPDSETDMGSTLVGSVQWSGWRAERSPAPVLGADSLSGGDVAVGEDVGAQSAAVNERAEKAGTM